MKNNHFFIYFSLKFSFFKKQKEELLARLDSFNRENAKSFYFLLKCRKNFYLTFFSSLLEEIFISGTRISPRCSSLEYERILNTSPSNLSTENEAFVGNKSFSEYSSALRPRIPPTKERITAA